MGRFERSVFQSSFVAVDPSSFLSQGKEYFLNGFVLGMYLIYSWKFCRDIETLMVFLLAFYVLFAYVICYLCVVPLLRIKCVKKIKELGTWSVNYKPISAN